MGFQTYSTAWCWIIPSHSDITILHANLLLKYWFDMEKWQKKPSSMSCILLPNSLCEERQFTETEVRLFFPTQGISQVKLCSTVQCNTGYFQRFSVFLFRISIFTNGQKPLYSWSFGNKLAILSFHWLKIKKNILLPHQPNYRAHSVPMKPSDISCIIITSFWRAENEIHSSLKWFIVCVGKNYLHIRAKTNSILFPPRTRRCRGT